MRISLVSATAAIVFLAPVAGADRGTVPSPEDFQKCYEAAETTVQVHECQNAELSALKAEMAAALTTFLKGLEDGRTEEGITAAKYVRKAQKNWIKYREANCEVAGAVMRGGTGQGLLIADCQIAMFRARASELRRQAEELLLD